MAQMYPSSFPPQPHTRAYRDAEKMVYDACANLPASWSVIYNLHWIAPDSGRLEGECDFVIVGPEVGLLVLETKGGGVRCERGRWYSVDRTNRQHEIKNPAKQAQAGKFALLDFLSKRGAGSVPQRMWHTHAVCFPHLRRAQFPPLPELPEPIAIFEDDLPTLETALLHAAQFMNQTRPPCNVSLEECRRMAELVTPSFAAAGRWSPELFEQKYAIDRLTAEQCRLLQSAATNRRISLTGPAGSGKTVAAISLAKHVLRTGRRVMVLVPTRSLRCYYEQLLPVPEAMVQCFDQPADVVAVLQQNELDLLVVDEAQDTPDEIKAILFGEPGSYSGQVLLLHDSNQRLAAGKFIVPASYARIVFDRVMRSTLEIGALSTRFYLSDSVTPRIEGPTGAPVEEIAIPKDGGLAGHVSQFITRMVREYDITFRDVVVLFGRSSGKLLRTGNVIYDGVGFRDAAKIWPEDCDDARCVSCCSVAEFRGLESPVVVLCEVDDLVEELLVEACYVGMSRAQLILGIAGHAGTLERIRRLDLTPIARERQRVARRDFQDARNASRISRILAVGTFAQGRVAKVDAHAVVVRLWSPECNVIVPRRRITGDPTLDLSVAFRRGQSVSVVIEEIDCANGRVWACFPQGFKLNLEFGTGRDPVKDRHLGDLGAASKKTGKVHGGEAKGGGDKR